MAGNAIRPLVGFDYQLIGFHRLCAINIGDFNLDLESTFRDTDAFLGARCVPWR